ncbi:MAG TPA: PqqD family peptide modification chaperone [Paracoccus sp.]|nr:PqqD family peptide modification chaperone [Paracoccus sp. (in: a-proteobacteria)]
MIHAEMAGLTHHHREGATARPFPQWCRLDFAGVSHPVLLPVDAPLLDGLSRVMRGWTVTASPVSGPQAGDVAFTRVTPEPGGYRLHSTHLDAPLPGLPVASALCGILADLAQSWFSQRTGALALHCAAARIGGRLVAFAGPARAGKSTLAARLTAEPDMQLFCDDVLPIGADGTALALGTAPRLRLPLPESVSQGFRAHVRAHLGPSDGRYGYVVTDTIAPHGTKDPLAALVILDRRAEGPACLHAMAPGEAASHLLRQNMSDFSGPAAALDTVSRVADGLICARLVYSDLDAAVQLLRTTFAGASAPNLAPPLPADTPATAAPLADPDAIWHRAPEAVIRRVSGAAFVWRPGEGRMWHLNLVAEAVWALLEIPGSARDLARTLAEAFPEEPPRKLLQDLRRLLGEMQQAGLSHPRPPEVM